MLAPAPHESGRRGLSPLHVLLSGVVLGQRMGGVRRHAEELLSRAGRILASEGGRLTVLLGTPPAEFDLPAEVVTRASGVPLTPPWSRVRAEGRAITTEVARAREADRPYDLVHTAHLPVPRRMPRPYSILLHDLRDLDRRFVSLPRYTAARVIMRRAVLGAAVVMTVSDTVRSSLIDRYPLDDDRVVVVPNGADHFMPLARSPGSDPPLVCIGALAPHKNLELVIRAIASDPRLPRVELHGSGTPQDLERIGRLARSLGVMERVALAGPFDDQDLPRILSTAGCVVIPSLIEGFGIVAVEAQRARAPLAVAAAGALPEVAGSGTPSFDPYDPTDCASAIRVALASTREDLETASARADRYTWDDSARRLVAGWRQAAGLGRA